MADDVLAELPTAYAVALRLRDAGGDDALIATALGIDLDEVEPLLDIAASKRDALESL